MFSFRMNWTSPQNSDTASLCQRKSMRRKNEAGDGWVLSVLMDCHGDRGNERSISEENITFYQIYLHKLKCRQFSTEQWVSRKSNFHGKLAAFSDISLVASLGIVSSHKEKNSISQLLAPKHLQLGWVVQLSVTTHVGTNIMSDKTMTSHCSQVSLKCLHWC